MNKCQYAVQLNLLYPTHFVYSQQFYSIEFIKTYHLLKSPCELAYLFIFKKYL